MHLWFFVLGVFFEVMFILHASPKPDMHLLSSLYLQILI